MSDKKICPKCGTECFLQDGYCANCGTKLGEVEEIQDNQEEVKNQENNLKNNTTDKCKKLGISSSAIKIIIGIACFILVFVITFGIFQYRQYQKDIAPLEVSQSFGQIGNALLKFTYDETKKNTDLSILFKGTIIQKWQIVYLKGYTNNYNLIDSNNKYKFNFEKIDLHVDQPLVLNYQVSDIQNSKDFAKFKKDISNINFNLSMPTVLVSDDQLRLKEKNRWLKELEQKGDKALREKKYSQAIAEYENAISYGNSDVKNKINSAKNMFLQETLYQGDKLLKERKFNDAIATYQMAKNIDSEIIDRRIAIAKEGIEFAKNFELTLLEYKECSDGIFLNGICGIIRNDTGKTVNALITVKFYDANGNYIDEETDHVSNLEAGENWKFKVLTTDSYSSYKITGVETSWF